MSATTWSVPVVTWLDDHAHLISKDHKESFEDGDKVDEQINRVPYIVIITAWVFLYDHLSVKQNQPTEHKETKIDMDLRRERGRERER